MVVIGFLGGVANAVREEVAGVRVHVAANGRPLRSAEVSDVVRAVD